MENEREKLRKSRMKERNWEIVGWKREIEKMQNEREKERKCRKREKLSKCKMKEINWEILKA